MADYDGKVKIGTELDESGLKKGLSGVGNLAKTGFATVGKVAAAAIGSASAAVAAFGTASVKTGMDFDAAVSQIAATMGVTTAEIDNLRDKAEELGASTSFSATQAAEGLNILAMSGLNAQQQIGAIEPVLNLAAAGALSLESAASYATGAMKGFGLQVEDVEYITNLMAKGATLANTDVNGLGEALSGAAAGASTYGQSVETTTVALLRLAEQNQTGSAAATALAAAMKNLYAPTDQAKKALNDLGVSAYDTAGNARDFNEVVNELDAKLSELTTQERADLETTIFGIQGKDAFDSMVKTSADKVEEFKEALAGADTEGGGIGAAAAQAATQLDNLKGDITIFQSALEGLQIKISDALSGSAREIVQFGTQALAQLTEAFQTGGKDALVDAGAGLVVDLVSGIAGEIPGLIETGADIILKLLSALQENLGGLASAGAEIISSIAEGIGRFLPQLFEIGGQLLQMLCDGVIAGIPFLFNTAAVMMDNMSSGLEEKIPDFISKGLDMVQDFASTLAENAPTLIESGITLITNLVKGIVNAIPVMIEKLPTIISTFANIINDNAPTVLQAGIEMLVTLVKGIISAIPTLIANVPKIIQAIVDVWSAFNWVNLGKNAITMLKKGILGMVNAVKAAGTSVLNSATSAVQKLPGELLKFGKSAVSNLRGALKGGVSGVADSAKKILKGIINIFKPNSLTEIGKNLIKGLWSGISSMTGWIMKQVGEFCDSLVGGIKDFFGIHSPSRLMEEEIGAPIVQGTAQGITDNLELVENAAEMMGEVVLGASEETLGQLQEQKDDSLENENLYWTAMTEATKRGVLEQKDALESLIDSKGDVLTNVTALFNNYISELEKTTDELMRSTGLFDEVAEKNKVSSGTLVKNLQDQIAMYGEYWAVMQSLKSRITNEGLRAALEEMGVDSLGELQALNSMTDEELAAYAALYDQKYAMCNLIAADSLSELRRDTESKLGQILGVTNVNLNEFAAAFDGTMDSVEQYVRQTVTNVGNLQNDMYDNGQDIMNGLIEGIDSKANELERTMSRMVSIAADAAAKAAQIHSPSRLFRDRIGKNMIAGVNVGMEDEAAHMEKTAENLAKRTMSSMQRVSAKDAVARLQGQSARRMESVEGNFWRYQGDSDREAGEDADIPQKLILEKGSITGEVTMDGEKVGTLVAPTVDVEIEKARRESER